MPMVPVVRSGETRVLLAVIKLRTAGRQPYLDVLATEVGLPRSTVVNHLRRLKAAGLVDWEPRRNGTLHATVTVVGVHP